MVKNPPGEVGLIPGSGRCPGVGNSNPRQYSCLRNAMDRGARWATAHGAAKSHMRLSARAHTHTHSHSLSLSQTQSIHPVNYLLLGCNWHNTMSLGNTVPDKRPDPNEHVLCDPHLHKFSRKIQPRGRKLHRGCLGEGDKSTNRSWVQLSLRDETF